MAQRNYLVSTTELSLTVSGSTIATGNVGNTLFVVVATMVRAGLSASELLGDSQTWPLHYVVASVSASTLEWRFKFQRRNSASEVQSESGYTTVHGGGEGTGTYDDSVSWASGTWNAGDELVVVWEFRKVSGGGNRNMSLDANGASYADAPQGAATHQRSIAIDGATAADVAVTRAVQRAVAIDGSTSIEIVASVEGGATTHHRSIMVDAATSIEAAATRAVLRAIAVDAATAFDATAARVVGRALAVDVATALDVAATRVLARTLAIDGATDATIAATRAALRALAIDGATSVEILATNPGAGPQTHQRAIVIDGSTPLDTTATRAVLRAIAVDAATAVDVSAARIVQRAIGVDAETGIDVATYRAVLRSIAIDAATSLDIEGSVHAGGDPVTHQRSIAIDAEALVEIVLTILADDPPIAAIFASTPMLAGFAGSFVTVFIKELDMKNEKRVRQGEVPKTITAQAFTASAFAKGSDYTGLTFKMVGAVTVEGAATLDEEGNLSFTFTGTDLDVLGTYEATWHAASGPGGEPQTFPEETNLRIVVIPAI